MTLTAPSVVIHPMLATDISDTHYMLENLIQQDRWWFSQKLDGERLLAIHRGSETFFLNRRGEPSRINIPHGILRDFENLPVAGALDGEYLDGKFYIFDSINSNASAPYHTRYDILRRIFAIWQPENCFRVKQVQGLNAKIQLLKDCREAGVEGIIARDHHSRYQTGISNTLIKYKLWKTCDVIVYEIARKGKSSLGVALLDENSKPIPVGAVTVTKELLDMARVGDVLEVKYIGASESHRLIQPSLLRVRTDKKPQECSMKQLQFITKTILGV